MTRVSSPLHVAIFIYPDAEVLDFAGPFEVFSTANRMAGKPVFKVSLISETSHTVPARGAFNILPDYTIDNHPPIDVLVIAGGVHPPQLTKTQVISWINNVYATACIVAAVCTGAFLLAEARLLDGKQVTTHWEDIPDLRRQYPALTVIENRRWVDQEKIVTSGGISAGIDMSLHLVERLSDRQLALKTARQMEWEWLQNS